jgi:CRISPR/Cas system CSM-associated protein Csm2 small subunit
MSKTPAKKGSSAMNLTDLDNKFNPAVIIPKRIEAALKKLGDNAMTALDFARAANITTNQLAEFGDEFEDYQIGVRDNGKIKKVWCGTKEFAAKARERLGV